MIRECPSYYKGKIECWDFIHDHNLSYFTGNAVKYITRAGMKTRGTYVEDLEKAIHYLQKAIDLENEIDISITL